MEVMQMYNTYLQETISLTRIKTEEDIVTFNLRVRFGYGGTCLFTKRNAVGMKILVKRTGTENFSKPTSSNLQRQSHSRDIRGSAA